MPPHYRLTKTRSPGGAVVVPAAAYGLVLNHSAIAVLHRVVGVGARGAGHDAEVLGRKETKGGAVRALNGERHDVAEARVVDAAAT
jgi:hypothetical protein